MLGKKLLWLVFALAVLSSGGCCRFWDRVCHDRHHTPCCVPCPQVCPPSGSFSSPAAVPVPNAPVRSSWQGNCP